MSSDSKSRKCPSLNSLSEQRPCDTDISILAEQIIHCLPVGIVAFDMNFNIIQTNHIVSDMIAVHKRIDASLAAGTDSTIWDNWTELLKNSIAKNNISSFENVAYHHNNTKKLLNIFCAPLKDTHKKTFGGTIVVEDITEKVKIQRQLAEAERLASIGKLASKVAHELNNPMDGIMRYINLTIRTLEKEKSQKPAEYLNQCKKGLQRMIQIITELLEFSRSTKTTPELTGIDNLIEEAISTIESRFDSTHIKIVRDYCKPMPKIISSNIFQVFCNLIKNAFDAMEKGGTLTISCRTSEDNTAVIQFCDTGPGIAAENINSVFEPFFTTKTQSRGTGLGLAICKDIVEKYGGNITAKNAPVRGSIFSVHLPLAP